MLKSVNRTVRQTAMVAMAIALMAIATSAQSRVVRVRFDPIFSMGFGSIVGLPAGEEVGWEGSAEANVPNPACLVANTASLDLTTNVCGVVTLTSASINFYNTFTDATLATISWPEDFLIGSAPEFFSVNSAGLVNGMTLDSPLSGSVSLNGDSFDVFLSFGLGTVFPDPEVFGIPTLELVKPDIAVYTSGQAVDGEPCPLVDGVDPCRVIAVWSVPEPAPLTLVGTGLALLGLMRRRRT